MSIISGILGGAIGWVAYVINLILGFIAGIIFTLCGALVNFALDLNSNIVGQPIVHIGWQIVLGFTNLGFILVIIIVAFATIFRVQSYAMKQTLWKLIVAALLVNFSLVIAGAFISVADNITVYFQQRSQMGPIQAAKTFAESFKVQKLLEVGGKGGATEELCWWRVEGLNMVEKVAGLCSKDEQGQVVVTLKDLSKRCVCEQVDQARKQKIMSGAMGQELSGTLLAAIASILFTVVFTFLGALTLFALAIMFFIRFITLGLLLVLSPIVWLFWILPSTKNLWQKWWHNFLRWVFFAPISSFFLYLAINSVQNLAFSDPTKSEAGIALEGALYQIGGIALVGNMVMLIGFMLGALMVSNSLGITFSKTAYGWAQNAGKMFGGWVGRKGLQYGPGAFLGRKGAEEGAKSRAEQIQAWASRQKPGIVKWGAGLIAGGTARLSAAGNEDLINRAKKQLEGKSLLELKNVAETTLDMPTRIAANQRLKDMKKLGGQNMTRLLTVEQRNKYNRYGQGAAFSDIEKSVGKSVEMMNAAMKGGGSALKIATEKFAKTLKMEDIKKGHWNDIYSGDKKAKKFGSDYETNEMLAKSLTGALAKNLPNAFMKIRPQIAGGNQRTFKTIVDGQLKILEGTGIKEDKDLAESIRESLKKNMGEATMDWGESDDKS